MWNENHEAKLKMFLNGFAIFAALLVVIMLWSNAQYTNNENSIEQGHLPAYATPPSGNSTAQDPVSGEPIVQDFFAGFVASDYKPAKYDAMVKACSKNKAEKVKFEATIYSVLETASSVVYNLADDDGNYYSVGDQSNGQQTKYKKADKIIIYGTTQSLSNFNNSEVPRINAAFFEDING